MMFWILIAFLTALAALSVLVPMSRAAHRRDGEAARADEAVYREQLEAVDGELERGLIDAETAEAARTEIARRLLAAHDRVASEAVTSHARPRLRAAQSLALLALPLAACGLYLVLGSPGNPDQPLHARLSAPAEGQSVDVLVARVERNLANNPEDGQGWAVLAPVYLRMGKPEASARAYANALRLLGPRADWLTDMGEAMTIANRGLVTVDAQRAFEQAVDLEPAAVKPRFFLALALGQEGRTDDAIAAWQSLLEGADETAAWVPVARRELQQLMGPGAAPAAAMPGPTQDEISAAGEMAAEDRQAMIVSMVEGLAARLEGEGGTAEEWNRLIRAYTVLGDRQQAEAALANALAAHAQSPEQLSLIKDAASQLGLSGS